jgi:hypothetical protein
MGDNMEVLKIYIEKISELEKIISVIDEKLINFLPNITEAWTIDQHIKHIVNTELNGIIRENSEELKSKILKEILDNEMWSDQNSINDASYHQCLTIFKSIRNEIKNIISKKSIDEILGNKIVIKRGNGEKMEFTLENTVIALNSHIDTHIEYIKRNIKEYNEIERAF